LNTANPVLALDWHPTKNGTLTPRDVTPRSNKKVWWRCKKGHDWEARITSRSRGNGCPYCSGQIASRDNNLLVRNPGVAAEWHPTYNQDLVPEKVTPMSKKKVWWICAKGHTWLARVASRNEGSGCPYCSVRVRNQCRSLEIFNPALAKEWNCARNGILKPWSVGPMSDKVVWWICKEGHEWQAKVANRSRGYGCPYCSGRIASNQNCLKITNPALASEWHPKKNLNLTPLDVSSGSSKKVWWKCKEGHEWEARIGSRARGNGCPYCSGRATCNDNCLLTLNPPLATEWHPSKNGDLSPKDVTPMSGKKVWWICAKGHAWEARVIRRSLGDGCPFCWAGVRQNRPKSQVEINLDHANTSN
jgi:DNA-directed RNA polymerase subunit RPC12/RpoP